MAENEATTEPIRKVALAQTYIKEKYSDTIGLATSILGQVLLGTLKGSKRKKEVIKLCLKDMKNEFSDRVAEDPRGEIEFMRAICNRNHPNFVRYIDAVEDNKLYCICIEYVIGGDMCTYIQNIGNGIDNNRAQKYFNQLTKAVYFMHKRGYCHLDLSLENVLWDKRNDIVKICDFGLSRKFPNGDINEYFAAATIRPGKKGYMAPEIYAYQKFNGEKADVFSLGVIIFILLTGFPPFNTPNASDKCFQFMYYGKLEWLLKQWKLNDIISADCRDLLSKIFCHPKKRISISEMLQHPYLHENIDDIDQEILTYSNLTHEEVPPPPVKDENNVSSAVLKQNKQETTPHVVEEGKNEKVQTQTKSRKSITSIVKKHKRKSISKGKSKREKKESTVKTKTKTKKTKNDTNKPMESIREQSPSHSTHSERSTSPSIHSHESHESHESHHSCDDHKSNQESSHENISHENTSHENSGHENTCQNQAQIANLRQHLNETQLITQKYSNNNGNFTPNANDYDNDRKEGDYETYPDPYHRTHDNQERRFSQASNSQSQDAGSVHSDHSNNESKDEKNKDINNNNTHTNE